METQVTQDFAVRHATVHYPDGTTEPIEYVEGHSHWNVFETVDIDKDDWRAHYSHYSDEVQLSYVTGPDNRTFYSTDNYRKIEIDWTEELTAVAEVELEGRRGGLLQRKTYDVVEEDRSPDVTIWERIEWEAYNDE